MSVRTVSSAQSLVAGPEFAPVPFVCLVSETPPTETVVCAVTTVVPVTFDTRLIVQLPPAPTVQGFADVNAPGPESIEKLICVPLGAFTNPFPSPALMLTCPVNVWVLPTGFVPLGVI